MKEREERLRDLDEALEAFLGHKRSGSGQDPEQLLDEHTEVRELLEPLVRFQPSAASQDGVRTHAVGAESSPDLPPDLPYERLGDFKLLERIGEGGMGVVYRAQQISLDRPVALKLLPRHLALVPQRLTRFRREASAGGRLRHPGLVAVHAVGEDQGVHFIAQELVPGGRTLANLLREESRTAQRPEAFYRRTARLFVKIADALAAAHAAGVIHRDIKPSNVLIDESGEPKVADFGLARLNDVMQLSQTGDFAGSPFYASPEQAAGDRDRIDGRSDVFSLGVTLYEALTHARPFDGNTSQQVLRRVLHDEPLDPRRLHAGVPHDLAVICLRCLEKSPARRYASMSALSDDLQRYLANEPIQARAPGVWTRSLKWIRRHPARATALSLGLLSLVVFVFLFARILDEREQAQANATRAERARAASDTVAEFVTRLFEAADPTHSRGRTLTATDLLDDGVETLAAELTDEPDIRARLLYTIGLAYHSLGENAKAEPILVEAHSIWEELHGPADRATSLKSLNLLASIYQSQNRFPEAEAIYRDLLERFDTDVGADFYIDMSNLSSVLRDQALYEEAERWALEALAGMREHGGTGEVVIALTNAALLHLTNGAVDAAEPLVTEAAGHLDEAFDATHPMRFHLLHAQARLARAQGRMEEAVAFAQQVLDGRELVFGRTHERTRDALAIAARYCVEAGSFERAEPMQLDLVERNLASIGPTHPHTLSSMNTLAVFYKENRRFRDAIHWFERVLAITRDLFAPGDPRTGTSTLNLIDCYVALEEPEPAFELAAGLVDTTPPDEPLFEEAVHVFEALRDRTGR